MRVADLLREADDQKNKEVRIYNPTMEDFTVMYDGKTFTIGSLESALFSYPIAQHIKKHLTDYILNKREKGFTPDMREEVEKEIVMDI